MPKNQGLWETVIAIISVGVGLAIAYLPGFDANFDSSLRLRIAAASAAISAILGLAVRILLSNAYALRELHKSRDAVGGLEHSIRQLVDTSLSAADVKGLSTMHPLLLGLGIQAMSMYTQSMDVSRTGFKMDLTDWAMRTNVTFWDHLTKYTKNNSDWHPRCFAVHRGDPMLWKTNSALASLNQQAAFIAEKGIIERVIIGPCSLEEVRQGITESFRTEIKSSLINDDASESANVVARHYGDVIRAMVGYGIKTSYRQGLPERDDFAFLEVERDRFLYLTWKYSSDGLRVDAGEFRDALPADKTFADWRALRKQAWEFTEDEVRRLCKEAAY